MFRLSLALSSNLSPLTLTMPMSPFDDICAFLASLDSSFATPIVTDLQPDGVVIKSTVEVPTQYARMPMAIVFKE
jgi:hypothetical protein